MKILNHFLFIPLLLGACTCILQGEVFDDFSQGEFFVSNSNQDSKQVSSPIDSKFFSNREVIGGGVDTGVTWSASLTSSSRDIAYSVSIDPPLTSPRSYLAFRYINEVGPFDFAGFESFEIKYSDLIGQGELVGFLGLAPAFNYDFSKPLDGSGIVTIPISQLGTPQRLNNSQQLEFRFFVSQDRFGVSEFGINIQEISIVPEPTTWSLLMLGGAPWVWRRFRAKVSRKLW